jgi:hypothetical protein
VNVCVDVYGSERVRSMRLRERERESGAFERARGIAHPEKSTIGKHDHERTRQIRIHLQFQ